MGRIFKARKGTRNISNKKAQIYGEELYSLAEIAKGKLTPQFVVKSARRKKSSLHDYFTWDDTEAAKEYRIYQARQLMGALEVTVETDKGKMEQYKALINVTGKVDYEEQDCPPCSEVVVRQSYVTIETVRESEIYLNELIEKAHQEMVVWGKKYRQYRELKGFKKFKTIFKEIEEMSLV